MSVTNSVILYGCEIWADALRQKRYRKKVVAVQRRGALRISSAYRTVSEPAVLVIAGVIPIDLLALERKRVYDGNGTVSRATARSHTMDEWQTRWETESRGRWSFRLIGDLRGWTEREHGEGGSNRMGKIPSPECQYGDSDADDALHTFFKCIGHVSPETLIEEMLSSPESWNAVAAFCKRVLRQKRREQL
uniref:Uncharacterized protein n=1 Tax=Homalodisca liturata TaxID=320908 RepID=A0A1B6JZR0_9HEMI